MPKAHSGSIESLGEIKDLLHLSTEDLRTRWTQTFKRSLPPTSRREFLLGSLAYELQARTSGHLKTSSHRALCSVAKDLTRGIPVKPAVTVIRPGSRLLRTWQGETHEVLALEKGFSYQGRTYSSLSEIAREITGARWSGPLFFGLKTPPPKTPKGPSAEKS